MTAISTFVGVVTLVTALIYRQSSLADQERSEWQRVTVYGIIQQSAGVTFEDIKRNYLPAVQQLTPGKLRNKDIQDEALRLVVLSLQKDRLIALMTDKKYRITADPLDNPVEKFRDAFAPLTEQLAKQESQKYARSAISNFLWGEGGKFTLDQVYQQLKADERFDIDLAEFHEAVNDLRSRRLVLLDNNGRLWAANDITVSPPAAQPSPRK